MRAADLNSVDVLKRHYYSPVPDVADFGVDFWDQQSELFGLKINAETGFQLLDNVISKHLDEFRARYELAATDTNSSAFYR